MSWLETSDPPRNRTWLETAPRPETVIRLNTAQWQPVRDAMPAQIDEHAMRELLVLGIETSCDETAAAVIRRTIDGRGHILANRVRSQWQEHAAFGGVVPEIAARAHLGCLDDIVRAALADAGVKLTDIDLIAATAGPGLIGGLLVGLTFAKGLSLATGIPLVAVNHLEGHALTVGLTNGLSPPYLLLLVSGGHTQTVGVEGVGEYRRIGTTIDDALGEAFDKTAKLLGLGAPGGPAVEAMAKRGDASAIDLPRPMLGRDVPNFSFAGLKTAVRRAATNLAREDVAGKQLSDADIANICASFQAAVGDVLLDRVRRAMADYGAGDDIGDSGAVRLPRTLVIAGGVAANKYLRGRLATLAQDTGYQLVEPPVALCSDNAAMIAWAGAARLAPDFEVGCGPSTGLINIELGLVGEEALGAVARARWPLDERAQPIIGHGRLGAKA